MAGDARCGHVPRKLTDFFDGNMLQAIDWEPVLFVWAISRRAEDALAPGGIDE